MSVNWQAMSFSEDENEGSYDDFHIATEAANQSLEGLERKCKGLKLSPSKAHEDDDDTSEDDSDTSEDDTSSEDGSTNASEGSEAADQGDGAAAAGGVGRLLPLVTLHLEVRSEDAEDNVVVRITPCGSPARVVPCDLEGVAAPETSCASSSDESSSADESESEQELDLEAEREYLENWPDPGEDPILREDVTHGLPEPEPIDGIVVLPDDNIRCIGTVVSVVDKVIVVAKDGNDHSLLSDGSVLCLEDRRLLGRLSDIIGAVANPKYIFRYTEGPTLPLEVTSGTKIYCVLKYSTQLVREELHEKGYDAAEVVGPDGLEEHAPFSSDDEEIDFQRRHNSKRKTQDASETGKARGQGQRGRGQRSRRERDPGTPASQQGGLNRGGGRSNQRRDGPGGRGLLFSSQGIPAGGAVGNRSRKQHYGDNAAFGRGNREGGRARSNAQPNQHVRPSASPSSSGPSTQGPTLATPSRLPAPYSIQPPQVQHQPSPVAHSAYMMLPQGQPVPPYMQPQTTQMIAYPASPQVVYGPPQMGMASTGSGYAVCPPQAWGSPPGVSQLPYAVNYWGSYVPPPPGLQYLNGSQPAQAQHPQGPHMPGSTWQGPHPPR
eukprot:jgi/Botrbrau1/296/Bobra.0022s0262.1